MIGSDSVGTWTQLNGSTVARRDHSACNINGVMYVFGGIDSYGNQLNDLWVYDSSIQGTNIYTVWEYITAYKNGALIFGKEPVPVTLDIDDSKDLTVEFHNLNTTASSNTITGIYKIKNNTSSVVDLREVKLRYYYTKDKDVLQYFYCDHAASMGSNGDNYTAFTSSVRGTFASMSPTTSMADTYLEISFADVTYARIPAGGIATINTRIARTDWTNYNMLNDYSYLTHWKPKKSCTINMSGHTASVVDGKMYAYNGTASGMWKYTPTTDTWSQITGCPVLGASHSACTINDKIYYFGGWLYGTVFTNKLWEYNPATNVWLEKTSCPVNLYEHTAVVIDNKMYIFGGYDSYGISNDLWMYNFGTDSWEQKASGATARSGHTAVIINDEMYVFGGNSGNRLNDLWKYNPSANTWMQLANGATVRYQHTAVIISGKMYVFGGYNNNGVLNDLWVYDPTSNTYYNVGGVPKQSTAFYNVGGTWKESNVLMNISGVWK